VLEGDRVNLCRRQRRIVLVTLVTIAAATSPGTTAAFVLKHTSAGSTIRWGGGCVFIHINSHGSDDISDGSDVSAVKQAMESWRGSTRHCSYLQLIPVESPDAVPGVAPEEVGDDGKNENVVYWIERGWRHDQDAIGLTALFYIDDANSPKDGRLFDADITLNGESFRFSTDGNPDMIDVQSVLAHELGHLMGLDHPCDTGEDEDLLSTSSPDPTSSADSSILESTMYPSFEPGETKKRTPESDDIEGVCELYPLDWDPGICDQDGSMVLTGGCRLAASGSPRSLAVLLLLIGLLSLRGRGV
jgi:hypothetical protein